MPKPARVPPTLTLVRTLLAAGLLALAVYLVSRELQPPGGAPGEPPSTGHRIFAYTAILAVSVVLVVVFVIGSYVMIRAGRALLSAGGKREKTTYTDAWAAGRVSEEEIRRATREPDAEPTDEEPPPGAPPGRA